MPQKRLKEISNQSGLTLNGKPPTVAQNNKKKKKKKDSAYSDKSERSRSSGSKKDIYTQRADNSKVVKKPDGVTTPLKTAVAVHGSPFAGVLNTAKKKAIHKEISKSIPSHAKVEKWEYSATGTPVRAVTADNKVLYPRTNNGVFYFFSNKAQGTDHKDEKAAHASIPVHSKAKNEIIDQPDMIEKEVKVHLSHKVLKLVAKEIKANHGKRKISQNKVMGGGATQHAHANGISLDNQSEWGHLVAHRFLSELSQHRDNLVSMTKETNTEMMVVENVLAKLAQISPNGIDLQVVAKLVPGTHIAESVKYNVSFSDFEIPFVFDCKQTNKPHVSNADVVKVFFNILFSDEKRAEAPKSAAVSPAPQFIFSRSLSDKQKRRLSFSKTLSESKDEGSKKKMKLPR